MGTTTTRIALAASTTALLAVLVVLDRWTGTQPAPFTAVAIPGPIVLAKRDGADRKPNPHDAKRIEESARTFLAAYLPYTHNQSAGLTKLPRGAADSVLVARLLAAPPHGRPNLQQERVGHMAVERLTDREAVVLADIKAGEQGYAVALGLTHRAGHWTVTDTRPVG